MNLGILFPTATTPFDGGSWGVTVEYSEEGYIRILGRKGVLVLNFIAGMPELEEIKQNRDAVLEIASFNPGYRYEEFDKVAAYGLAALG